MSWLILLSGLILRLPLFTQSLWLDEAIEALALQGQYGSLWGYSLSDFQPPLYHYLLLPWTQLAGTSEWALRLPALLAGLGTVYFLYRIGTDYFSARTGKIVGLLAASNPLLVYYSQEGRTYGLTTFFVTASIYYFLKLTNQQYNSKLTPIYYLLSTTAYLWTSYLSWFLWFALALYLLFSKRYRILMFHTLAALTLLFWLPQLVRSLQIGINDATKISGWGSVVGGVSLKALGLTWVKFALGRISFVNKAIYGGIVGLVGLLHLLVLINLRKLSPPNYQLLIILLWLLAPILLTTLISLWIPVYSYTRVLFVLPAYLLLLATFLSKYKSNIFSILLIASQLMALIYFWFTPRFHKEDWRSLATDLNRDQSAQVLMPSLRQDPALRYYQLSLPTSDAQNPALSAPRVYYINYVASAFDPEGKALGALATNGYTITSQKVFPGIQVDIYENRN